ncbi:MAG TPA: hypothetical protein VF653_19185 [Methylomirabilota bacterium]
MKRTTLAVLMIALAILAMAAPMAYAQAPAPKVTINGLIDNVTSYSRNTANYNGGLFNREDRLWYSRIRGRFDFIGEVGKAKGVLGIELDHVWGQAGSNDSTIVNAGGAATTAVQTGFGTDGSFDLNTDSRGIIEIKWLYVEFPVPLIPIPATARLGAQPFGASASYKLAAYANGDFPGVNVNWQFTPNVKLVTTYVQVEENLTGPTTKTGVSFAGIANTQNRGDDFAVIISPEITPFKGLDIKPLLSVFSAEGTTNGNARAGRGGVTTSAFFTQPDGSMRGGVHEERYTVGLDARLRMGPFSFDPTVMYQFGNRGTIGQASFASAGVVPGRHYYADISAWLVDLRGGFQLGPLLLEGLVVYSTGNNARSTTLNNVNYYQPLTTDTSYLADWGTQLTSLGIDYLNAYNEAGGRMAYPGAQIGWDKYGRGQVGFKATYAFTPALRAMAGVNGHWTAEAVDRNSTVVPGGGLLPSFTGGPRDTSHFVGTEFMALVSWRFADGLVWDNAAGYMLNGPALDAVTDPAAGGRNTHNPFIYTSRIRFTF